MTITKPLVTGTAIQDGTVANADIDNTTAWTFNIGVNVGTNTLNANHPLSVNTAAANISSIMFQHAGTAKGYVGVNGTGSQVFATGAPADSLSVSGNAGILFHITGTDAIQGSMIGGSWTLGSASYSAIYAHTLIANTAGYSLTVNNRAGQSSLAFQYNGSLTASIVSPSTGGLDFRNTTGGSTTLGAVNNSGVWTLANVPQTINSPTNGRVIRKIFNPTAFTGNVNIFSFVCDAFMGGAITIRYGGSIVSAGQGGGFIMIPFYSTSASVGFGTPVQQVVGAGSYLTITNFTFTYSGLTAYIQVNAGANTAAYGFDIEVFGYGVSQGTTY